MLMDLFRKAPAWDHYFLSLIINDLQAIGLLHKCMDNSTVKEKVSGPGGSHLQEDTDNAVQWLDNIHMKINGTKTNEMVLKKYPHSFHP